MLPFIAAAALTAASAYAASRENDQAERAQRDMAADNIALQKEFAQNSLRWKVEDAQKAGIHPLYALGAQGTSFSPVSLGSSPDHSISSGLADMGQNVTRAMSATRTAPEKEAAAINLQHAKANLDGQIIDNQIKQTQLRQMQATSPSFPTGGDTNFIPGQGNSGMKVNAAERTASQLGRLAQTAGWNPSVSLARTDTGFEPYIPQQMSESYEADPIGGLMWGVKNRIFPNFTGAGKPPKSQLPRGYDDWDYSFSNQEWRPVKGKGSYPYEKFNKKVSNWQDKMPTGFHTFFRR